MQHKHKELSKGQTIFEQYRIISDEKALGGSSFVQRCEDTLGGGDELAAKFHLSEELFIREVDFVKKLRHTNVVRLIEAFEPDPKNENHAYAVTLWQCGSYNLEEFGRYTRPFELNHAKAIATDVINGLIACSKHKIVHCDIKPQNVMYFRDSTSFDRWKLIDFDASCYFGEPVQRGTLDFCAPEMLLQEPATTAMDVFSLGRLINWMFISENSWLWNKKDSLIDDKEKESILLSEEALEVCNSIKHEATVYIIKALTAKQPDLRKTLQGVLRSSYFSGNMHTKMISDNNNSDFAKLRPVNTNEWGKGTKIDPRSLKSIGMIVENRFILLKSSFRRNDSKVIWLAYMPKKYINCCVKFYEDKKEYQRTIQTLSQLNHQLQKNIISFKFAFEAKPNSPYYPWSILVFDDGPVSLRNIVENKRYKDGRYFSELDVHTKWDALKAVVNALKACQQYGIVCVDLHPSGIVRHHYNYTDPGIWKLCRFEHSRNIGEEVNLSKSPWCTPEAAVAMKENMMFRATFEMDIVSLGYLIYFMIGHVPFRSVNKMETLATQAEFDLTKFMVPNAIARRILSQLLKKNPQERMSLRDLIKSPFITDVQTME